MTQVFRRAVALGLALVALVVAPLAAKALMIAPMPTPTRVANSDAVVVGPVTSIEEKTTKSKKDGVEYKVAVVKVEKNIKGVKDTTHIRVAWPAPQVAPPQPQPNPGDPPVLIRPFPRPGRPAGMALAKDQEALLFLKKHEAEEFYIGAEFFSVVNKQGNATFAAEVADAERAVKILADPIASLKSKDQDERLLAAFLQLNKYRMQRTGNEKQQPIDAAESKLILTAIAEADWNQNQPNKPQSWYMTRPQNLFYQLNLTPADGWTQPQPNKQNPQNFQNELQAAMKKWLTDNADKFVIKRFIDGGPQDR